MVQFDFNKGHVGETNAFDNGKFQRWLRSQGQIF